MSRNSTTQRDITRRGGVFAHVHLAGLDPDGVVDDAVAMSGTDDWERVQAVLGRSLTRTDLVRLALASGKTRTAKAIRDDLAKVGFPASAPQVASCLYELRGRGEVYRVRYGTYQLKPSTG